MIEAFINRLDAYTKLSPEAFNSKRADYQGGADTKVICPNFGVVEETWFDAGTRPRNRGRIFARICRSLCTPLKEYTESANKYAPRLGGFGRR